MKFFTKKAISLMLVLLLMALLVAGCGQDASSPDDSDDSTPATDDSADKAADDEDGKEDEEAGDEPEEEVTITVATWVNNKDGEGNYVDEEVAKAFTEANPNIKVDWQLLSENDSTEYLTKIDLDIAGGEEYDVVSYPTRTEYVDRIRRDMLIPIDDYLAAEGKTLADIYYIDSTYDGKVYGVPWDVKSQFVMFNKDMLDEANLSIPDADWTWEDFRDYAKQLTKGEGADKRYGSYFWSIPAFKMFGLQHAYGSDPYLTEDGQSNLTDPDIKEWLEFVYGDMEKEDGSLYPYAEAKTGNISYRDLFFQGKVAMLPIGNWMIQEVGGSLEQYPHDWVTAFAPVPQWKDYPTGSSTESAGFNCIPVSAKYPDQAYKYIRFNSDEGVYIRATGVPPVHDYDVDKIAEIMMGGREELYDVDSLTATLTSTNIVSVTNTYPYSKKVTDSVDAILEKYVVGGADIDEVIAEADEAVKEIIITSED